MQGNRATRAAHSAEPATPPTETTVRISLSHLRVEGRAVLVDAELIDGEPYPTLTLSLQRSGAELVVGVASFSSTRYFLDLALLQKVFARVHDYAAKHEPKLTELFALVKS